MILMNVRVIIEITLNNLTVNQPLAWFRITNSKSDEKRFSHFLQKVYYTNLMKLSVCWKANN